MNELDNIYVIGNVENEETISKKIMDMYDISLNDYREMYEMKGGKCDICENVNDINNTVIDLHQDTDNKIVRGLLCANCKNGIISFAYNPYNMIKAAKYIHAGNVKIEGKLDNE